MKALTLSGRILFALPMAVFGFGHLANAGQMAGMVPSFIPGGVIWVYFTGLVLLASAISIIIGKFVKYAGLGLGILLLIFAFAIWLPMLGNEQMKQMAFPGLMKDIAMAGAAFFIAGIYSAENKSAGI
jgi:putative oxidoreductase